MHSIAVAFLREECCLNGADRDGHLQPDVPLIGKTTQRQPFTTAAHLGHIARKGAASQTMAERMPEGKVGAVRWLRAEERADRVNATDKLVIALPRELTLQQQITL